MSRGSGAGGGDRGPGIGESKTRPDPGSPLIIALQEQLGLKLESQRGVVPFYVIERVEKPDVDGVSTTAEPVSAEPPAR